MSRKGHGTAMDVMDDRIRGLAIRFADEVARIVRQGMAEEVAGEVVSILRSALGQAPVRLNVGAGPGDGRVGKPPVPVKCPVPGCTAKGIRAKRNFCADHSDALTDAEKLRFREEPLGHRRQPTRGVGKAATSAKAPKRPSKKG